MPTTTKMGIVYPASTDLVKDGATAMGTISTTVDNKTGLILISTTSFSAVSSQSINDIFSTNYNRYLIKFNATASASVALNFRLRVGGTDNSSAQYRSQFVRGIAGTASAARSTGDTFWQVGSIDTINTYLDLELLNPFETAITSGRSEFAEATNGDINNYMYKLGISVTTSYTGFTFYPSSGTMTGSVSVYGFNK